jgi:cyanophycin synthetase
LEEARALGLDINIVYPEKEVVEISNGSRKIIAKSVFSISNDEASANATLARNKEITYRFWEHGGIPFPRSCYFKDSTSFPSDATKLPLNFPVVFKKSDGARSMGVEVGISSFQELQNIVSRSIGSFIIQEMAFGKEYRLLMYRGRLLGALEHAPPKLRGNGIDTIATLLQKKNARRQKSILINNKIIQTLKKNNLTLDSVPAEGESVLLQATSCLSEGATSIECTDIVHEKIIALAKKSAEMVNMRLAGIDIICEDISVNPDAQKISFLETNSFPSLSIHYTPMVGKPIRVIKMILEDIFDLHSTA